MEEIIALLIPIAICAVMPIMIVWLNLRTRNRTVDKKAEVLIKAIENGADIDPNLLVEPEKPSKRQNLLKMRLLARLQLGVIASLAGVSALTIYLFKAAGIWSLYVSVVFLAVGIGTLTAYFVGKSYLAPEIAAEEKKTAEMSVETTERAGNDEPEK